MATTYTPIATQTLSSNQQAITFSSISGSYTDLRLICFAQGSAGLDVLLRFNSDTATNYSTTYLSGNGTSALSSRASSSSSILAESGSGFSTANPGIVIVDVFSYSNATTYKTALCRWSTTTSSTGTIGASVGLWRSTSSISSLVITSSQEFIGGSTFTLYGIKAA
jgi:hypothetical protein